MDKLMGRFLDTLEKRCSIEPLPIPEEVREIRLPLGYLKLNMYNWRADKLRKISIMRCTIKAPRLEIFAIEIYPESGYDLPLLAIDFSVMKKKTFVYMNFIPLFTDQGYRDKYIAPLAPVFAKYRIVPEKQPKPWMEPYLTRYTVYAMPDNALLESSKACAVDYLSLYLDMLERAEDIKDAEHRGQVNKASLTYCDQLSAKDGSRKMLGRFIGMKRANTIFDEVIR
jgi:hypothetical protein